MMKALNLHGINDLRYEDVAMPERKTDEVLVKIKAVGICGSDIPRVFIKGTYHFPTIIGHEFAGEIVEAEDSSLIGRGAAIFPLLPCGKCSACQTGHYAQCKAYDYYGSRRDGGMAEYLAVKKRNICLLPAGVPYEWGAMTEPAAVAWHAFRKVAVGVGDALLIYGIGTIGLLVAQWARGAGVGKIILAGRTDDKVAIAEEMGFMAVNVTKVKLQEYLADITGGNMCDGCIEGTGSSEGLESCLCSTRNFAKIVLMGNPGGAMELSQDAYWKILRKELQLVGTWNSSYNDMENDWQKAVMAMQNGVLQLDALITDKYKLSEYEAAFALMHERKKPYLKVMFTLD